MLNNLWFVRSDAQIFNDKISVPSESDWLVLVAIILIYCPPAWSLEKSRTRNRSTYNLEWPKCTQLARCVCVCGEGFGDCWHSLSSPGSCGGCPGG